MLIAPEAAESSRGRSLSTPCAPHPPCPANAGIHHSFPNLLCGLGSPAETVAVMGKVTGGKNAT